MLRDGQAGEADAGAGAGRLVHLAVDQRAFRALAAALLVDARFDELVIKVVALAGALADAGEHRIAAVGLRDVVDQLLNEHGLADASTAEQADLAALGVRRQQINDLDAGDENFRFGGLLGVFRRRPMDRPQALGLDRPALVHRLTDHVDDTAEQFLAHRDRDRLPGVGHALAAHQTFGGVHRDGAHGVLTQVLGDLEN